MTACSTCSGQAGRVVQSVGHLTRSSNILSFLLPFFQERQLSVTGECVYEVLVNRLGGLSLPRLVGWLFWV